MNRLPKKKKGANPDDGSDGWCTPQWLALALGHFDTDPASNATSHIDATIAYWLERGQDGLKLPWRGSVWNNPPYSNPLPWAERLAVHPHAWAALVKLDTSTEWWRAIMANSDDWAPFRWRLRFERRGLPSITPDFCSALVWGQGWEPSEDLQGHLWMRRGSRSAIVRPGISVGVQSDLVK